jgi:hypothetical protein
MAQTKWAIRLLFSNIPATVGKRCTGEKSGLFRQDGGPSKSLQKSNWLGGTLSGPKSPIFCLRRDHANQLHKKIALHPFSFERVGGPPPSVFFARTSVFFPAMWPAAYFLYSNFIGDSTTIQEPCHRVSLTNMRNLFIR